MRKYSKQGLARRKEERKDFPEFYQKHIQIIKDGKLNCQECGCRLIGDVSEVAHILNKSFFKSISTEDSNILYLCSWRSSGNNNCHSKFDSGKEKEMSVFSIAQERIKQMIEKITENINWKLINKYNL
jgi:hypothetical protein